MEDFTRKDICDERMRNLSNRADDHKERMDRLEETQRQLSAVSVQLNEILKALTTQMQKHEDSIEHLKTKPANTMDKIIGALISAVISTAVSIVVLKLSTGV